ncbi:NUDIX hydrolase (plasmid) [Bacillus toyonensis]
MQNSFSRVLIKDTSNKILIIQDRADVWNFPGGKQELNETPLECAKREVKEEIGLHVEDLTEIYQGNFRFGDTQWQGYFYFANSVSGIPFINELEKIKEIQFINRYEVINFPLELTEIIRKILKKPSTPNKIN